MVKRLRFLTVALFVMLAAVMQAQVTTSSMSGRVTDVNGPVIGATVIATHEPSGTTYGTVTNMEGRFNLNGMRVGGPYTVKISYIGYGDDISEGIILRLGENYVHNVVLAEETVALGEVVVTATRTRFTSEKPVHLPTSITISSLICLLSTGALQILHGCLRMLPA